MPPIHIDFNTFLSVLAFSFSVYVLLSGRASALKERVQKLEVACARIETEQKNAITHQDLSALYTRLDEVAKVVHRIDGQIAVTNNQNTQILTALVKKAGV